jgi:hypothetical protein
VFGELTFAADPHSCTANIKDVISDCTEAHARDACSKAKDAEDCVQKKTPTFSDECNKNGALAWCKQCEFKPPGCPIMRPSVPRHGRRHKIPTS